MARDKGFRESIEMYELHKQGWTTRQIAERFGYTPQYVNWLFRYYRYPVRSLRSKPAD